MPHQHHPHDSHDHTSDSHASHSHHDHSHIPTNKKVLIFSFILISTFMCIEFIGGYMTRSLALISDAGHMLSDAVALGIALLAVYISQKVATERKSFGYQRFEILAAAFNGLTLIGISLYICIEALFRFQQPENIQVFGMLTISTIGLIINIIVAWIMFRHSDTEHDLNMRSAFLHVLGDLLGSVAAIIAGLCIYFFAWQWADPFVSILVALLILKSGVSVTQKAAHILMQGTPERFNLNEIKAQLKQHPQVLEVKQLHLWSLNSHELVLSCHLNVDATLSLHEAHNLVHQLEHDFEQQGIEHVTIQVGTLNASHHHVHD